MTVSVGIDVSKDKHDCFIVSSDGAILAEELKALSSEEIATLRKILNE